MRGVKEDKAGSEHVPPGASSQNFLFSLRQPRGARLRTMPIYMLVHHQSKCS
jgi:hypothetical protein